MMIIIYNHILNIIKKKFSLCVELISRRHVIWTVYVRSCSYQTPPTAVVFESSQRPLLKEVTRVSNDPSVWHQ
jgi:hypothetical protein